MPFVMESVSNIFNRKSKTKSHKRAPRRKLNKFYLVFFFLYNKIKNII